MLPTSASTRVYREPQENIPRTRKHRDRLRDLTRDYVAHTRPTAPLSLEELRIHADTLVNNTSNAPYRDYTALLINNALWHDTVAGIPFHKRLLLLPRCLRDAASCPATCDEIGLLCQHCGRCMIDAFKRQAESLGYAVLVAEGSPIVMNLIETGQIEAVIGVSCMYTLERVYPYMEAGAVPGIAIPLLYDGCRDTAVDNDWIWEAMYESAAERSERLDLDALRRRVRSWFSLPALTEALRGPSCPTHDLALNWLARSGKRWRPILSVATFTALSNGNTLVHEDIQKQTALAVECFHKASLIHDDIEDGDTLRNGHPTLHAEHGIPIALNVGDYLLGEGYRLLSEIDLPDRQRCALVQIAAQGHRTLCLGQGQELNWAGHPRVLDVEEVLQIFRDKTAPAFAVALRVGAILAEADQGIHDILQCYSDALGMAYQIRDDLDDLVADDHDRRQIIRRPSILIALAAEQLAKDERKPLDRAIRHLPSESQALQTVQDLFRAHGIERRAADLLEHHKSLAIRHLSGLNNTGLKSLLRRVLSKIFFDFDIMGCCNDPTV